jgi:hypothetical protein
MLCGGYAYGLVGDGNEPTSQFALTEISTQVRHFHQETSQLSLTTHTGQGFLGRYGVTAEQVIAEIAPHLSSLDLVLDQLTTGADMNTVHEVYRLRLGNRRLFNTYISLHTTQGKLVALHYDLPTSFPPEQAPLDSEYIPVLSLGFGDLPQGSQQRERKGMAESGSFLVPAWLLERTQDGNTQRFIIDAQTGAVLQEEQINFSLADVYATGPQDGQLIQTKLPDLLGTGFLDGKQARVFAPSASDPRATATAGNFQFNPQSEGLEFDQVMAYYSTTKVIKYFADRFNFSMNGVGMRVSTNTLAAGLSDNAQYVPPPEGPAILVGYGSESMQNLARDTDVIFHEFAHHVIYQFMPAIAGEAGVLHEGIADYFAYAINGDPYLGESLLPDRPYLRTGALASDVRYDDPEYSRSRYALGELLATSLWELRGLIGEDFDRIVFEALPYLPRKASIKDFLLALFNAERDLFPLAEDKSDANLYGTNKCQILSVLVNRGFANELGSIEGANCGLDMNVESVLSANRLAGIKDPDQFNGPSFSFGLGGKSCSTLGVSTPVTTWLWILATPVLAFWRRRRSL